MSFFPVSNTEPVQPTQKNLLGIQSLRGIAAFWVVLDHASQIFAVPFLPQWLLVGESGVDLFFVISGFVMMHITPRAFRDWPDQAAFLARRICRIYPVYWAITIPWMLLRQINPGALFHHAHDHYDLVSNLFLIPSHSAPCLVAAWTLVHELHFYCLASLIFYFGWRARGLLMAAWAAVIAGGYIVHPGLFDNPFCNVWLSPLSLEFISGMVLAEIVRLFPLKLSGKMACSLILLVILAAISAGLRHGRFAIDVRDPIRVLVYGLPAFTIVWIVLQMESRRCWRWVGKIAWLGDRSYSIYLLHLPLLTLLLAGVSRLLRHAPPVVASLTVLVGILLMVIPVEIFYRVVEKPSHRLARRWGDWPKSWRRWSNPFPEFFPSPENASRQFPPAGETS